MKPILITLIIVVGFVSVVNIQAQTNSPKRIIYQMCNASRMTDSVSEQTCAELQDHYNSEFLCQRRDTLADNKCWVEVK